jgi:hypothetical protein
VSWYRPDECSLIFACDTCPAEYKVLGLSLSFVGASDHMRSIGWITLKRVGRDWTHHCPECASQAQHDHEDHKRAEAERERIKQRNG